MQPTCDAVQVISKSCFDLYDSVKKKLSQVRDGRGGFDDFPGSRREEEQRNSYTAFDDVESSGAGFGGSFELASVRRQFIR